MRKNPEISKGVDSLLVILYLILATIGVMSIFAATHRDEDIVSGFLSFKTDYSKQLLFFGISIILGILFC